MSVQILALRTYIDRAGKVRKAEKYFERGWRANSVQDLFLNIESVVDHVPDHERWNLYYTAAECEEVKGRKLKRQHIIPLDIDDIDIKKLDDYVKIVCRELDIREEQTGIVFTGNGLQFLIGIKNPITDAGYFDRERHLYKAMCGKLNQAFYMHGLDGHADTIVFSPARLLRLPNTVNRKPNKPERTAMIIQGNIVNIDFDLSEKTGIPKVVEGEHIHPRAFMKFPDPDPVGVQEGCDFIKYAKENQANISEPQWYAMLSVVGRLPDGESLCHEYSKKHPDYDWDDTQFKYKQALDASGPRTCENISSLWDGCASCPNNGTVKSPIQLKSELYIGTKETGFYEMLIDRKGQEKRGRPNYDDLVKYFASLYPYVVMEESNIVFIYDGKKWYDISRNFLHSFAEDNFDPKPSSNMCREFELKIKRTNLRSQDWFHVDGMVNFENGVLDIKTNEFLEHSEEYGFKYVLPFDYNPLAVCPRFTQFLKEVTEEQQSLIDILVEFMGYSVSGIDPVIGQKALILYGDGANGKSVFIDILRSLAGKDNYCTMSIGHEINKLENRYQLSGKLFNVSEETPTLAMMDSSIFKALVAGGEVQARKLYCDPFSMKNYAKIIMACNELPTNADFSRGMLRRLLIVPFNAVFTKDNRDVHILEKLKKELSGIFNLALEGYHRFNRQEGFTESNIVDRALQDYIDENDSVSNFMTDMCVLDSTTEFTSTSDLYKNYDMYCFQNGMKKDNLPVFSRGLYRILKGIYGKDCNIRRGKKRERGAFGIKLITDNTGDY